MLNIAIDYAKRGWSVFPCAGKKPLTPNGFKDATRDEKILKTLFNSRPCNIAAATGLISGIVVLDIDNKNGVNGFKSLEELEKEYGKLPATLAATTPNDGCHFYFKIDKPIGCKVGVRAGIDIRGDGGSIILPPSLIGTKYYEWIEAPISPAPEWLYKLEKVREYVDLSDGDKKITINRNDTLMKIGVSFRKAGLNEEDIYNNLVRINNDRCIPPLGLAEVKTIAQSVSKYSVQGEGIPQFTEVWASERFVEYFGEDVIYCNKLGGWFIWNGIIWQHDEMDKIIKLGKETVKKIYEGAIISGDKKLPAVAKNLQTAGKIKSILSLSQENLSISDVEFDQSLDTIICQNGCLDLRTGKLTDFNKDNLDTKCINLNYNSDIKCSEWFKFLGDIFLEDTNLVRWLQRVLGYCLSGRVSEHHFYICWGIGGNGKSTLLKHIQAILGAYSCVIPASSLMEKRDEGIGNDIASLKGSRFIIASESERFKKLAEAKIKNLTGDDTIKTRQMYKDFFEFKMTGKIFFQTNYKPKITGTDKGIWRRVKLIPFEYIVSNVDDKLDDKLKAEYEGILAWMVEGAKQWYAEGLGDCERVNAAVENYRTDSDILGAFVKERCLFGDMFSVSLIQLQDEIEKWTRENKYDVKITRPWISEYMENLNIKKEQDWSRGDNRGKTIFKGIGLKA